MPAAGKARSPGRDFRGPLQGGTPEEAKLMSSGMAMAQGLEA